MTWRALVVAAAIAAVAADAKDDANKKDLQALQGAWKAQKLTFDGREVPADVIAKIRFVFEGTKVSLEPAGPGGDVGPFTVDATLNPKVLTFTSEKMKIVAVGIYELDGDTLRLCLANGNVPPKEFAAEKGSQARLFVLRRVKK
jgi:uncharacterized protein (TIGR03067 family)